MEKAPDYYRQLLEKWIRSEIDPQEATELMDHLEKDASSRVLLQKLKEEFDLKPELPVNLPEGMSERTRGELLKKIEQAPVITLERSSSRFKWLRSSVAAILILGLGIATYYIVLRDDKKTREELVETGTPVQPVNDVAAGTNKAILTLADGTQIELDDKARGRLAIKGVESVTNNQGELVYEKNKAAFPGEEIYNTLSSSRGQSYSLVLADGSKLWLNAASSVRFPVAFTGNDRQVEIKGEVFFDIAKDAARPFRVKANDMEIEVIGTQFNINAYPDESTINTTLVEGSVKVSANKKDIRLKPGQQSRLSLNGNLQVMNNVNIDEITAWKNGYFHFEYADLKSILRQFARWYDIEVVFEGEVKDRSFFAIVSRNSSLSNVLKMLDANDVRFRIEGKKLIVQSY